MAEIVACPNCQRNLQVPENFLGQKVKCPECQHSFEASATSSAVQSSAPAATSVAPKPKPANDADETDDRPRRRRRFEDDDDDDDYRPRHRRQYLAPHRGSLILTLGILSIFIAPLILGTIAWIMGSADLRAMQEGRMDPDGESQTRTGRNIGMVMVCIYIALIVAMFGFFGIMIATGNMH